MKVSFACIRSKYCLEKYSQAKHNKGIAIIELFTATLRLLVLQIVDFFDRNAVNTSSAIPQPCHLLSTLHTKDQWTAAAEHCPNCPCQVGIRYFYAESNALVSLSSCFYLMILQRMGKLVLAT